MRTTSDPVRVALLAAFAALAIPSLRAESPTWDEPYHLAQGFRYLRTGDASFLHEQHPPGFQALAALPLLVRGVPLDPLPEDDPRNLAAMLRFSGAFLEADSGRVLHLFPWARGVVLVAALGLGWLLYDAALRMYGRTAARLALAVYALDPNLLAHGRLVTTDLGAALGSWLVLVALLRWSRLPGVRRAAIVGLALGAALLAKHSALLLAAWLLPLAAIAAFGRTGVREALRGAVVCYVVAGIVVWGAHGFEVGPVQTRPGGEWGAAGDSADRVAEGLPLEGVVVPAPTYVHGVARTLGHVYSRGHTAYLKGKHSAKGWPEYFPYAFAVKTPLPTLLLLALASLSFLRVRPRREEWVWIAFIAITFGTAIRGSLNIGYRHLLPMLPPMFLLIGRLASDAVLARTPARGRPLRLAAGLLVVWLAVGTIRQHRHPLAYFNELAGGPENGWKHLVDASLDWGQDLPGLADWLRAHDVDTVRLSYFGTVNPSLYGIRWLPIQLPVRAPGAKPMREDIPPGVYAVSVSKLVEVQSLGEGPLTVFQELEPAASIGHSIHVYVVD